MEKTDQSETRDLMNVKTFSQLPFIRPAPVKEKAIRLFGKEFGGGDSNSNDPHEELAELFPDTNTREENKDNENNGKSSRKFECHYCCRNFPTSQALGGHQNAHKRERQHAKRLHHQSAMLHNAISDHPHLYGVMNYPLGSASAPASWTSYSSNSSYSTTNINGFYGHHGSSYSRPPPNGSPLALWRIPSVRTSTGTALRREHSSTHQLPLFSNNHDLKRSSISGSDSQSRFDYESKPSMQDHISLDLHL